jgi:phosphonate transport system substrate-binding protein
MNRSNFVRLGLSLLASLVLGSVSTAQAQSVLRVTAIPDESPSELARKAAPLAAYLESQLGLKVQFVPVTDYAAAVESLVNKRVDFAWFGGFTFVQANVRSGGKIIPLVQREEDTQFKSVFITSDPSISTLNDLKGKDVSFGSQSSTSGHLMPRSALLAGEHQSGQGFQTRRLQWRPRRHDRCSRLRQGSGGRTEHSGLGALCR